MESLQNPIKLRSPLELRLLHLMKQNERLISKELQLICKFESELRKSISPNDAGLVFTSPEDKAAVRIQACYRGVRGRRERDRLKELQEERRLEEEMKQQKR